MINCNNKIVKRTLIGIIAIAFILGISIAQKRYNYEKHNDKVQLIVSYKGLQTLSNYESTPMDDLLKEIKEKNRSSGCISKRIHINGLRKSRKSNRIKRVRNYEFISCRAY